MTSRSIAALSARYAIRAATELEENRRRQGELTEKKMLLQREEVLLLDILTLARRYEDASGYAPASARATNRGRAAAVEGTSRPPLLGDLLMSLLDGRHEPCPAAELRDELLERYPDRSPTLQVVRNTLESLVAKGRIHRRKRQRSVRYSSSEPVTTPPDSRAPTEA